MEHCSLSFLLFLPPSNLFHCHCHVLLYSKTPKQVFFNPIKYILTSFTHSVLLIINSTFFRLTSKNYFSQTAIIYL